MIVLMEVQSQDFLFFSSQNNNLIKNIEEV